MKKYLISGMAALMFCGVFTSCTRDTDLGGGQGQQQKVMETYEQAFLTRFGQPAADQDWGFGSPRSNTRATGEFANHVGAYPDANMWTSKGFLAPDPLTHAQKLRAQYYFQMNQIINPNRPDNGQIDFFMQQVYDGGDDPMAGKSLEKYPSADFTPGSNNYITSGEHMDHLTCGPDHTHTYNFNNGTCSTNDNVANRDQTDVNNTDGKQQHSDEIQLMLNTKTSCFGYANSDASYVRDDRWTLVSATTIDDFCDNDPGFASWLASKLNAGEVDKKCDDEFHRSFIGFDFDMLPDEHVFAGTEHWENGDASNGWQRIYKGKTYADYDYYRYDLYGARYHYLSANGNQFCGESQTIDPEPDQETALQLIANGWLPATGSANKRWIKVGGCADGYYSDWIVTFMPATPGENPNPVTEIEKLRVIAEDLSVGENTDFDFNDVVFDVIWTKTFSDETKTNLTSQKVEIKLLAAGGTLLLYVDGKEVHEQFGVDQYTMVNTDAKAHGLKGKDDAQPVTWETSNYSGSTIGDIANSIVVKVIKNGEEYLIRAERGHIASKIGVKFINDQEYEWCYERQDIEDKYSLMTGESPFQAWVQGIYPYDDWYTYAYDEIMKYRNTLNGAQGN